MCFPENSLACQMLVFLTLSTWVPGLSQKTRKEKVPLPNNVTVSGDNYKHAAGFVFFPVTSDWRKCFSEIVCFPSLPSHCRCRWEDNCCPDGRWGHRIIAHISRLSLTQHCQLWWPSHWPSSWQLEEVTGVFDFSLKGKACKQGWVAGVWVSDYIGKSHPSGFETDSVLKQYKGEA